MNKGSDRLLPGHQRASKCDVNQATLPSQIKLKNNDKKAEEQLTESNSLRFQSFLLSKLKLKAFVPAQFMPKSRDMIADKQSTYCRQRYSKQRKAFLALINNSLRVSSQPTRAFPEDNGVIPNQTTSRDLPTSCSRDNPQGCTEDYVVKSFNLKVLQPSEKVVETKTSPTSQKIITESHFHRTRSNIEKRCCRSKTSSFSINFRKKVLAITLWNIIIIFNFMVLSSSGASAIWWLPGKNSNLVDTTQICRWALQVGGAQAEMCQHQTSVINQVQKGIELGMRRCELEFRSDRWNCSQTSKLYFGRVLEQDIRETAFVQALIAAAINHQITSACSKGVLEECGCTNIQELRRRLLALEAHKRDIPVTNTQLQRAVKAFDWGGCADNIEYGYLKSKQFLDVTENEGNGGGIDAIIKLHNQEAGRLAIKNHKKRNCLCHGLSGSCTMWTCWDNMPRFEEVGRRLRNRYDYALRVATGNDGETLIPVRRHRQRTLRRRPATRRTRSIEDNLSEIHKGRIFGKTENFRQKRAMGAVKNRYRKRRRGSMALKISKEDLLHFQQSPSFCNRSKRNGSLGTRGRQCDPSHQGIGSCNNLCCGRGYERHVENVTENCNCRFQYCCKVVCEECAKTYIRYRCS